MNDAMSKCKYREHLSDVQIAFILIFDKVKTSQWEIVKYIKYSHDAVRNVLNNYNFDTFKRHQPRWEYQRKTTECKDQYIECTLK